MNPTRKKKPKTMIVNLKKKHTRPYVDAGRPNVGYYILTNFSRVECVRVSGYVCVDERYVARKSGKQAKKSRKYEAAEESRYRYAHRQAS